jgi:hypothetical protein
MSEVFWIPIVAIIGSFTMVVTIVFLGTRGKQRKAELRAEVQMKLIDKFGSSAEFVNFLQSTSGQQFLDAPRRVSRDRVLGALTGGLICGFLGLAFLALGFFMDDRGFWVPAFILGGIGCALFISAAISWKLTRQSDTEVSATRS